MKIVIGENTKINNLFAEKMNALLTDEMCGIKFIKEEVEIFIPYEEVLNNGFITNTKVYLEELLITLNVKKLYLSQQNISYLQELRDFYKIEIYTDYSV
jgi:hypothetical protein